MGDKKIIAFAISDTHIHNWTKFNDDKKRTLTQLRVLFDLTVAAKAFEVPILHCGDFFNEGIHINTELLEILFGFNEPPFRKFYTPKMFGTILAISGNHDMPKRNTFESRSPSLLNMMSNTFEAIRCIDFKSIGIGKKISIHGIPYLDNNIGMEQAIQERLMNVKEGDRNILLLHTDYPGAIDTNGSKQGSVENLPYKLLKKFDLVLCGHIHKHQKLSNNIYMVGAPIQQRRTDRNSDMGYLAIYSDMSVEFKNLSDNYPKFIDVETKEEVKDDGNYYTIVGEKKPIFESEINTKVTKHLSTNSLARRYLREIDVTDPDKKKLLKQILKKSKEDDNV